MTKKTVVSSTNGIANRFSWEYSPGATKSHSSHMMIGDAMNRPVRTPIFSVSMKASVGS